MPNWELISFIKASEIRLGILESLNERIQTPTELKAKYNVPISRISAVLKDLMRNGLVNNLTPERRKSKLYSLTEKGKSVLAEIQKISKSGDK